MALRLSFQEDEQKKENTINYDQRGNGRGYYRRLKLREAKSKYFVCFLEREGGRDLLIFFCTNQHISTQITMCYYRVVGFLVISAKGNEKEDVKKRLISSNNSIKKIRGSASSADFLIFLFLILSCFNSIPYFIIFSLQCENNNIPILINARCCWKLIFVSKEEREGRNSRRGMLKFSFFFQRNITC